jgi:hypothetical protein
VHQRAQDELADSLEGLFDTAEIRQTHVAWRAGGGEVSCTRPAAALTAASGEPERVSRPVATAPFAVPLPTGEKILDEVAVTELGARARAAALAFIASLSLFVIFAAAVLVLFHLLQAGGAGGGHGSDVARFSGGHWGGGGGGGDGGSSDGGGAWR